MFNFCWSLVILLWWPAHISVLHVSHCVAGTFPYLWSQPVWCNDSVILSTAEYKSLWCFHSVIYKCVFYEFVAPYTCIHLCACVVECIEGFAGSWMLLYQLTTVVLLSGWSQSWYCHSFLSSLACICLFDCIAWPRHCFSGEWVWWCLDLIIGQALLSYSEVL